MTNDEIDDFKEYMKKDENGIKKFFRKLLLKIGLHMPISRREFLAHRYEFSCLTKYVSEIESLTRSDIMNLAVNFANMKKTNEKTKKENEYNDPNYQ